MPIGPARMPLLDHLGELRRRMTIVVVSLLAATIVLYFAAPVIVDILKEPIRPYLQPGEDLSLLGSLSGFSIKFGVALRSAIIMCTPMILWQILAFFLPALKPKERKWVVPTIFAAVALFFIGLIFCYFIIAPAAFEWLIEESRSVAHVIPELKDYIDIEILLMIGFGIGFELPLIVFYLAVFHIVPYASFRAAWRYIYVIMLVVSASVTPDASPVTLMFMYAAMLSLYEISLLVTRLIIVMREGKAGLTGSRLDFLKSDDEDEGE
ncbi:twin-arginine translocase subunit TatC [Collinsella sp. zg1085]|uniref:twin-arginine translocase subunit TatC n=1 Tax=Collinsella sp. zg1085 TaxID=2844380 RepID=UPI001C0B49FE|nr:twin-arginine translocase subunit TatC [Collinsella sp. zg1085]QWT17380.1 twin-arginine translocase subunit TatC [Collinsella sp. zg1085]